MDTEETAALELLVQFWPRAPDRPWRAVLRRAGREDLEFLDPKALAGYLERLLSGQAGLR